MAKQTRKKRIKKNIPSGIAHIHSSFNNTIITITDLSGKVITWGSSGTAGFKGSKKSTAFAAQVAAESVAKTAIENGMNEVEVNVKGPGPGRDAAVRSIAAAGLCVTSIKDVTPLPHNGCRPQKKPRG